MKIEFLPAKNGEITARFNSLFLHSAYSPNNEAKRFVENLNIQFTPDYIICCEPCLSYITPYLKEKYPGVKLAVIRFSTDFYKYNSDFNYVFNYPQNDFETILLNTLGEESLCSSYFLSWSPSAKIFPELSNQLWNSIKKVSEKAKTILVTRQYFEKKWFLNSCKNLCNAKKLYSISKNIDKPVLIIASGPSLNSKLEAIKNNRNKFFIICLSSAISCLTENGIIPDLCFSTDGGYWAGEHLKKLKQQKLPLALSIEAYCQTQILKSNPILLLKYEDGLSNTIISNLKLPLQLANRNGTVSGTALDFALANSSSSIYFFGLDLATGKGFQHTQPNELEINSSLKDSNITSKEKRIAASTQGSASLEIYKEWFQQKQLNGRKVYRIIETKEKQNSLGQIKDISLEDFLKETADYKSGNNLFEKYFEKAQFSLNRAQLHTEILKILHSTETKKLLFPLDYVSIGHNTENKTFLENRINNELEKITIKIEKPFK